MAGKGVHTLLHAFIEIADQTNAHLVIGGQGTFREALTLMLESLRAGDQRTYQTILKLGWAFDEKPGAPLETLVKYTDSDAFVRLRAKAHETSAFARIHFAGYLEHPVMAGFLANAHLSVLPSCIPEAYPLSLVESLACGLLPVVADHGGPSDFADMLAETTGMSRALFAFAPQPDHAVDDLSRVLLQRLNDGPGQHPSARQLAMNKFGWKALAQKTTDFYEDVRMNFRYDNAVRTLGPSA